MWLESLSTWMSCGGGWKVRWTSKTSLPPWPRTFECSLRCMLEKWKTRYMLCSPICLTGWPRTHGSSCFRHLVYTLCWLLSVLASRVADSRSSSGFQIYMVDDLQITKGPTESSVLRCLSSIIASLFSKVFDAGRPQDNAPA